MTRVPGERGEAVGAQKRRRMAVGIVGQRVVAEEELLVRAVIA